MPIYDHNGSATTEIGKLYDNNGSANTQIGKVYDNNGSANSLIYSAEEILIGSGAQSNVISNSGNWRMIGAGYKPSYSVSPSMIQFSGGGGQRNTELYCTQPLPKGYSTLKYTSVFKNENAASLCFGIGTSTTSYNVYTSYTAGEHTIALDPSTNYYISIKLWCTYTGDATIQITSLILS